MTTCRSRLPFALALASLALARVAAAEAPKPTAPKKEQCFDAHERAQVAQKEGRLKAARTDFELCSNAACPKLVAAECADGLAKAKARMPSIVVVAGGTSGAKLFIDEIEQSGVPAGPIELDAGVHLLRLSTADGRRVDKRINLKPGEREIKIALELPDASRGEPAPPAPAPSAAPERRAAPSTLVWVMGGVAVVGLAGFVGFGLSGKGKESDLDACKPSCQREDVDSMRRSYLFADVSLGIALAAGGVGAYLYLSKPEPSEAALWVRAVPEARGAGAAVGGRF